LPRAHSVWSALSSGAPVKKAKARSSGSEGGKKRYFVKVKIAAPNKNCQEWNRSPSENGSPL
jgi:hypothetical protein